MCNFYKIILLINFLNAFSNVLWSQSPQSAVVFQYDVIVPKIKSFFQVVAQQETPVKLEQLTAFMGEYSEVKKPVSIIKSGDYFVVQPDTIGVLSIQIELKDTVEMKRFQVSPMKAVGRLGRFTAKGSKKMKVTELCMLEGIQATIECCGFDARCQVVGFETILAKKQNGIERLMSKGGRFTDSVQQLFATACRGDFVIFRDIKYRCPGVNLIQRLEDMVFEIK
ncbi:MAG: GldM family protein [Saprospiraceae bacterium]